MLPYHTPNLRWLTVYRAHQVLGAALKNKFTKPTMAIVSTDKSFIVWLKLRCQNVVLGEFNGPSFSIKSPLDYNMKR